jgi:DNA-binding response OmpR family regulator
MPTVFILDDDVNLLVALDLLLSRNAYKVYTFSNSADLMLTLGQLIPDIILLDILLSETKTGEVVCQELKQTYNYPNKIYLFSATHIADNELLKSGADGFMDKPFEIEDLLNMLNKSLFKQP